MTVAPPNSPMSDDADLPGPPTLQREVTGQIQTRLCITCPAEVAPYKEDYVKQCDECYRDISTKRLCSKCALPKILVTDPEWKTTCGTCFKNAEKRRCLSCMEPKIPDYEPTWRNLCGECFKNKDLYRVCSSCNQKAIKPGSAKFLTKCGPCWLQGRSGTHEQCPGCKDQDPRLKKRKDMPFCRTCMKKKGLIKMVKSVKQDKI